MPDETNYNCSPETVDIIEKYSSPSRELLPQVISQYDIAQKAKADNAGMGKVYFGRDKRTMQFVVLKTYQSNKEAFEKEARFALGLGRHPNVVYTYSVIKEDGKYYMVMEHIGPRPHSLEEAVQGDTLQRELEIFPNGLEDPKQALLWAIDFCHGMEYLYSQKGFQGHNDIKPGNLFITQEGVLKVGDFGLVNEKKGSTPDYRPPEFWQGEEGEQRDIWSFGIVFYEMLNGPKNPQYPTIYGGQKIDKETKGYAYLDWKLIEKSKYSDILKKCLAEDKKERYAHFADLRTDLEKEFKNLGGNLRGHLHQEVNLTAYEWNGKGIGWYVLREYEKSMPCYTKAIELDANFAEAYTNRGCVLAYNFKCPKAAIVDYTKAIELDPQDETAYKYRFDAFGYLRCYKDAIEDLNKLINLSPHPIWYLMRGEMYCNKKCYKEAVLDFDKFIKIKIQEKKMYAYFWDSMHFPTVWEKANIPIQSVLDLFTYAIQQNPEQSLRYMQRGDVYRHLKFYKEAIADYTKTINLEPNFAAAYYHRGTVYIDLKKYTKAEQDFLIALRINRNYIASLKCLLEIYHKTNNLKKAAQIQKQLDELKHHQGD